jgi:RimJ/RimL family protein N-acetyltransferase
MANDMNVYLKPLTILDVTQAYVDWFKDTEVVRFSENQYRSFTLEGQKDYVSSCSANEDIELFGVFDARKHIGNVALAGLLSPHNRAEVTYMIGDRDYWGKGTASYAVSEVVKIAARDYNLNKLVAGAVGANIGSLRVLEKNGFVLEGVRLKHLLYHGIFYDQHDYGLMLDI